MLSKNLIKLIRSLDMKKFRKETNLFVAEGEKLVNDLIASGVECHKIIAIEKYASALKNVRNVEVVTVDDDELKKVSFLKSPQGIVGLFKQKNCIPDVGTTRRELCLALDDVQDPGNLGTIIRIADWFGIEHIFCSIGTVDVYNPKTVQATMGALARVNIYYVDLPDFLASLDSSIPVYGTFLNGKNIYEHKLSTNGVIVMGNEGKGIGAECENYIDERILIPNYPAGRATSESLNVSTATAIVCGEFRRRCF
jgi:TrmH family RNA methyltransferase